MSTVVLSLPLAWCRSVAMAAVPVSIAMMVPRPWRHPVPPRCGLAGQVLLPVPVPLPMAMGPPWRRPPVGRGVGPRGPRSPFLR